jgi:hypothetical protein
VNQIYPDGEHHQQQQGLLVHASQAHSAWTAPEGTGAPAARKHYSARCARHSVCPE